MARVAGVARRGERRKQEAQKRREECLIHARGERGKCVKRGESRGPREAKEIKNKDHKMREERQEKRCKSPASGQSKR